MCVKTLCNTDSVLKRPRQYFQTLLNLFAALIYRLSMLIFFAEDHLSEKLLNCSEIKIL